MTFKDQMNQAVQLKNYPPQRIISLVPSQTELLFELGLEDEVIGITKFCVHPRQWFHNKKRVGGTKKVKRDIIAELNPDLIIGNKEENTREDIKYLQERYPTWMSDIHTVDEAMDMILQVGALCGRAVEAENHLQEIKKARQGIPSTEKKIKVAYVIWRKPWMVVGNNTYIHSFLSDCGFENVFGDRPRYPQVEKKELQELDVDYIFLSSEPFPFKEKHQKELSGNLPADKILLVDGEMFSWYGPRMRKGFDYLRKLKEGLSEE
jgi:ABC-type Fe3+-hydroxamate transport system substrate-binding protein